jgi:hypothetical protein
MNAPPFNHNYDHVLCVTYDHKLLFYYGSTAPFGLWPLFQFLNLYTVGRTPWTGDQPVARPLPKYRTTQTQNKRTQTSML